MSFNIKFVSFPLDNQPFDLKISKTLYNMKYFHLSVGFIGVLNFSLFHIIFAAALVALVIVEIKLRLLRR